MNRIMELADAMAVASHGQKDGPLLDAMKALKAEVNRVEAEITALREAAHALLSNEEHATSGGMRSYQVGSPTWELWEALREAAKGGQIAPGAKP